MRVNNSKGDKLSLQSVIAILGFFATSLVIYDKAVTGFLGWRINVKFFGYVQPNDFNTWDFSFLKTASYVCAIAFVLSGFAAFMAFMSLSIKVFRIPVRNNAPYYKMKKNHPIIMDILTGFGAVVLSYLAFIGLILWGSHQPLSDIFGLYFGLGVLVSMLMFSVINYVDSYGMTLKTLATMFIIEIILLLIVFIGVASVSRSISDGILNTGHFQYQYYPKSNNRLIINVDCLSNLQIKTGNIIKACPIGKNDICYQALNNKQVLLKVNRGVYVPTSELLIVKNYAHTYPLSFKTCNIIFQPQ